MRTLRNDQWQNIRDFLEACPDVYLGTEAESRRFMEHLILDSTVVCAHPCAAGAAKKRRSD